MLDNYSPKYSSRYSKSRIAVNSEVYGSLAQGSSGTAISTAEPLGAAVRKCCARGNPKPDLGPRRRTRTASRRRSPFAGRPVSRRLCGGSPQALQRILLRLKPRQALWLRWRSISRMTWLSRTPKADECRTMLSRLRFRSPRSTSPT